MPTTQIKKIYAKNIALIRLLFSLIVNAFTFFGIIVWKWNFFTIIYLYWFEEVIRIVFRLIENKINYRKNKISKSESRFQHKATLKMFFPMGIYFIFILVIVGIVAVPNHDAFIANFMTVAFQNIEFNVNLLLAVLSEIAILVYLVRKYNQSKNSTSLKEELSEEVIQENLEREFLRKQQEEESKRYKNLYQKDMAKNRNQQLSPQMIVLHLSIIFGTLLYFAANTDKLPIQINMGAAGEFAFVIVFAAVQTIGEVFAFVKGRNK